MQAYQVIKSKVENEKIVVAELARSAGMESELLRRSLLGVRKLKADELIAICVKIGLNIDDFNDELKAS